MSTVTLNLSRKWRSKQFKDIVGQRLSLKILQNSLYKNKLFPVYLFAGQHGCGKTSTARVFAAALNCSNLSTFQHDPKNTIVPCLTCDSCVAMATNRHPDFIEIDAASNTGVDNVRQIIDASALLPVMGNKKIYLIDEAHMLSKAAFNAFLKILEEPPDSVVFILATTDSHKILETVKSRCFQLFFDPIDSAVLTKHLQFVCEKESIPYKKDGLDLIVKESSGSARDALNLLEQVRFSSAVLDKQAVQSVLGQVDDHALLVLFSLLVQGNETELISFVATNNLNNYAADYVWRRLVELIRSALWLKYGASTTLFSQDETTIKDYTKACSVQQLTDMLELFYSNEPLFVKTTAQHELLEMILLQIIQKRTRKVDPSGSAPLTTASSVSSDHEEDLDDDQDEDEDDDDEQDDQEDAYQANNLWQQFLTDIKALKDPLLLSIFGQAHLKEFNSRTSTCTITFSVQHSFFKELLAQMEDLWKPLLEKRTGKAPVTLQIEFVEREVKQDNLSKRLKRSFNTPQQSRNNFGDLDVSDLHRWPKTNLVLDYFPGTVREIQGE